MQWQPDMIWFDNARSWGSANYETQKLFMTNVGDEVVPSTSSTTPAASGPITGAVGLSTWATSAAYDDVQVTAADGASLLADDFSSGDGRWTEATAAGSWAVRDGAYVQSDEAAENTLVTAGDEGWQNYDLKVKATKRSGKEGFLVAFGVKDTGNHYWWNLGGWDNTRSGVEKTVDGAKQTVVQDGTTVETGRTHDLRVEVRGRQVTLYLDGRKWGGFTDDKVAEPFRQVVTRDKATGDLILKVVNDQATTARTKIDLGDRAKVDTHRPGDHAGRRPGRGEHGGDPAGQTEDVDLRRSRQSLLVQLPRALGDVHAHQDGVSKAAAAVGNHLLPERRLQPGRFWHARAVRARALGRRKQGS